MAKKYGQTWWGENWLKALANIDWENRLPRGRTYANKGAVKKITINKNRIDANVQGVRYNPYKIKIEIPSFTEKEKKLLTEKITNNTLLITKLLNRELPADLNDIALSNGIRIFPSSWNDFDMYCSCPDWAVPCKHLASVIYIIANEIDKNPFLIFQLHNFDIIEALKKQNLTLDSSTKENIKTIDDFVINKASLHTDFSPDNREASWDKKTSDNIDFSIIEDIRENLLELLNSNPLFYEKDFKSILNSAYKNISRSTSATIIRQHPDSDKLPEIQESGKISIQLNEKFEVANISILSAKGNLKLNQPLNVKFLIHTLDDIELKNIKNYSEYIRILYNIYHFTLKILEKSAFIPQLLNIGKNRYKIRWIPAIINQEVKSVFNQLAAVTPPDILCFKYKPANRKTETAKYQTTEEQILSICALFIEFMLKEFKLFRGSWNSYYGSDKILDLFFQGKPTVFDDFSEKEIPNTIQLWLSKFYVTHKNYIPLIKIEEKNNDFSVDVMVEDKKQPYNEPIHLNKFISQKKYEKVKYDVLKDLTLLSEHFTQLTEVIRTDGRKKLLFNSVEFIEIFLKILPAIRLFGINILLPKTLQHLVRPQLSLNLQSNGSQKIGSYLDLQKMLSFEWQIAVGEEIISADEFKKLVKGLSGIVKIKEQFVLIDKDDIDKLFNNLNNPPKLNANELLKTGLTEEYNNAKIGLSKEAKKAIESLIKIEKVELPDNLYATLRPYQLSGYEWMYKNAKLGFGSLIADDMGLGKTVQVLATLLKFKQEGFLKKKKVLIIVPTTILTNWQKEIEKFTPDLKSLIYHGQKRKLDIKKPDLIITTYGMIRSEAEKFQKTKWYCIVIDEAQNIKNPGTNQTRAIKKLKADVKIAMSGTPVENRLSEYWSILDYSNKGYLGSLTKFTEEFAKPIQIYRNHERANTFRKITEPFILRRLKSDKNIIKDLPDKIENNQYCSLTKGQAAIYQNVVNNMMKDIENNEGIAKKGLVLKLITALKQICNHPYHFLKKGELTASLSGKSTLLFNILENIYENNEKTLIFTQYKEMGSLLVKLIQENFNTKPLFLHGGLSRKKRDEMVENFQEKRNEKTFILSLKAGGTGLNLTAARNVIHYDLWWNPAVEAQATDRAYRIGQKENVMVYRLLTKGTFEEKIEDMLKIKKELANLTVSTGEKWIGYLSNNELKDLVNLSSQ